MSRDAVRIFLPVMALTIVLTAAAPATATDEELLDEPSLQARVEAADLAFSRGDVVAAMQELRIAAEAGYVPAQVKLAYHLDYGEQDEEALQWYRRAAEAGDPEAQFSLAKMYASGEATEQDNEQALALFIAAADQHYTRAIRMLARSYELGGAVTDISYERAVAWLSAGVEAEDLWCTRRLGDAYRFGQLGLRIDREKAAMLDGLASTLAVRRLDGGQAEDDND